MKKPSLLEWLRAKKRAKTGMQARMLYGVVWYANEEEWAKVKALAADPEPFEATYEDWVDMIEENLKMFTLRGILFQKIIVQAEELSVWCRLHNKPNDSNARSEYVSEILQTRQKANGG